MVLARKRMFKLLDLKKGGKGPHIAVPNFCLAECSKAFASIFLGNASGSGERNYGQTVDAMLDWVSSSRKGIIHSYELRRDHLVDVEEVFRADHKLADRDEKRLSGLDGLVISMGRALERSKGKGKVIIVTNDKRLAQVCNQNQNRFPRAVYIKEQEIPGT